MFIPIFTYRHERIILLTKKKIEKILVTLFQFIVCQDYQSYAQQEDNGKYNHRYAFYRTFRNYRTINHP